MALGDEQERVEIFLPIDVPAGGDHRFGGVDHGATATPIGFARSREGGQNHEHEATHDAGCDRFRVRGKPEPVLRNQANRTVFHWALDRRAPPGGRGAWDARDRGGVSGAGGANPRHAARLHRPFT
ncbi:hypothetical protein LBMAG53_28410 [Planctomycetota bacterium]|nr:hypothetical protein LBMAG53_28410 [Planctomycetota bacterium]